jgi:hypothetical protein
MRVSIDSRLADHEGCWRWTRSCHACHRVGCRERGSVVRTMIPQLYRCNTHIMESSAPGIVIVSTFADFPPQDSIHVRGKPPLSLELVANSPTNYGMHFWADKSFPLPCANTRNE